MEYEKQRKVIIILSIIIAMVLVGLAKLSLLSAEPSAAKKVAALSATTANRLMMSPPQVVKNECEEMQLPPAVDRCKPFMFLDEGSLQDLLNSYPACLEEAPYTLNLVPVPEIELSKPLVIYGRTDDPFTIKGLKVVAGKEFPKGEPAIKVMGGGVNIDNLQANGFEKAVQLSDTSKHIVAFGHTNNHPINQEDMVVCN